MSDGLESGCNAKCEPTATPLLCDLPPHDSGLHYDDAEGLWWQTVAEHDEQEAKP